MKCYKLLSRVSLSALALLLFGLCSCAHSPLPTKTDATQEWTILAGDVTLYARAFGRSSDPTLIIVGGGPGVSHDYMLGLNAIAGPELRVVFYDQRGTGRSTAPASERWDLGAYSDDLEAVRVAVGAQRPKILGHSWGGGVALAYAERHSENLSSLILVDSIAITAESKARLEKQIGARVVELKREGLIPAKIPRGSGDDCLASQRAIAPIYYANPRHEAARQQVGTCSSRAFKLTFDTMAQFDLRPDAVRVTVPVLILYGDKDTFQSRDSVADFTFALPRARTVAIADCGHIPWIERPDLFWPELRTFLNVPTS